MIKQFCAALAIAATSGFGMASAQSYYEAPWSSFDFLTDQRWTEINNRLTNQRIDMMNDDIKREIEERREAEAKEALDLGETATTDLTPLRPYLAEIDMTEERAAKVLAMYSEVAAKLDVPANDSASGIAAFLAGTYAAYTNKPFPDEFFRPLYEQFADTLVEDEAFKQMPLPQRTEYYQRLVVAGMIHQLNQLDLQANPQPEQIAKMRDAAGKAFSEIAGISPDRVRFTEDGLTVAEAE